MVPHVFRVANPKILESKWNNIPTKDEIIIDMFFLNMNM